MYEKGKNNEALDELSEISLYQQHSSTALYHPNHPPLSITESI